MRKVLLFLVICVAAMTNITAQVSDTIWIDGSHSRLHTVVDKPQATGVFDVTILCHGFSSNLEFPLIAEASKNIVAGGMATVRFDFNGHGKSEGEFVDMTVPNEIEDLEKVIEWTKKQPWCRSISLVGHSQGGVVVSMVAGKIGYPGIRRIVLAAPAAVLREDAIMGRTMGASFKYWDIKGDYVPINLGGKIWHLGKNYIETAVHLPIYDTAWLYNGPVFIMQGTHDEIVPFTYAELYKKGYTNSNLVLIPGQDHSFTISTVDCALNISDFILK